MKLLIQPDMPKAKLFDILLIILLLGAAVSSSDIVSADNSHSNSYKEVYAKGETFQAEINLQNIASKDIIIKTGNRTLIPGALIVLLENSSGVYFNIPLSYPSGGATLIAGNRTVNKSIQFTISNSTADFSVKPGFVVLKKDTQTFSIRANNNLNSNVLINISCSANILPARKSIDLAPLSYKYIRFYVKDLKNSLNEWVGLKSSNTTYNISIKSVIPQQNEYLDHHPSSEELSEESYANQKSANGSAKPQPFAIARDKIKKRFLVNGIVTHKALPSEVMGSYLYIRSKSNKPILVNISPSGYLGHYISLSDSSIVLKPNSTSKVYVSLKAPETTGNYTGAITASSENFSDRLEILVSVQQKSEQSNKSSKEAAEKGDLFKDKISINLSEFENKNGSESRKSDFLIGTILLAVLAILIVAVLHMLRKKPKRKSFIEYALKNRKK